ncbi:EAL domain-containing protein [Aliikangiella sp. G2MR2-5]|uniref:EAL domain-containing protein n=1 Tax=Aliikangiella sp. G2MR2-5 TaxID=2788943 RepID=UPI0018AA4F81|nr:EAL domain-containing protein [Aliikangiella sp. G2MR2-5]
MGDLNFSFFRNLMNRLGYILVCLFIPSVVEAVELTASEKLYLKQVGQIRFCTAISSLPLDDIQDGKHIGIGAEYMKHFRNFMQIPFVLVETSSWQESLDAIKQGKCDVIGLAARTPQRESYLIFTKTYVEVPFVVVTTQEKFFVSKLGDLVEKNLSLGVQRGYAYVDLLKNRYPEINLVEVESTEDALEKVTSGKLFGFMSGLNMAGYAIQSGGYTNLKINGQFDELSTIKLGLGVRKGMPQLRAIINKSIDSIPDTVKKQIDGSWLTVTYQIVEDRGRLFQILIIASVILVFLGYRQFHLNQHNKQLAIREKEIWHQANYDFLTGLPNRRLFQDRLSHKITRTTRTGSSFALLLIDLDKFKEVNDTLGHDQGDKLLVEAANRIESCIRKSDSVARLGGDEFVVLVDDTIQRGSVETVVQKILDSLSKPYELKEQCYMSASVGITLCPRDSRDMVELLKNADQAMYAAKETGRSQFHYFTPELQNSAIKRMQLIKELRIAVSEQQFEVFYQPIVSLDSGICYKAEALIRWNHPENGLVSPFDFIPILEDTGMINKVGHWIFLEAAKKANQLRNHGYPDFQISVNASPIQFQSLSTFDWLSKLKKENIATSAVAIEITESTLMEQIHMVSEHLLELRDAGVQVSLDDFGTGYSSLAYLNRFDIDYLKIDKSFVQSMDAKTNDLALCEAIIVMAHKLGLKVIAEGVETEEQAELLFNAGCDFGQGYFFARPLESSQLDSFLKARQQKAS